MSKRWWGPKELEALLQPIDAVHEDPDNARLHPDVNLDQIQASYEQFGQRKPVVATPEGKILDGNGQWRVMQRMGWTHVAVAPFEGNAAEQVAYALAANRSGESSAWDNDALVRSLQDLPEAMIEVAGWNQEDLAALAEKVAPPDFKEYDETLPDAEGEPGRIEVECPKCKHRFKRRK